MIWSDHDPFAAEPLLRLTAEIVPIEQARERRDRARHRRPPRYRSAAARVAAAPLWPAHRLYARLERAWT